MATTPNYGWVTPAPTDFVTDLPADFEIFADAVDADLAGLLGGTTGQVLTKDSATDHDFSWATPAAGGWTLISTTAMSGTGTVSLTSIPNTYKDLRVIVNDYYPSTAESLRLGFNSDTSSFFNNFWTEYNAGTTTSDGSRGTGPLSLNVNNATRAADENNFAIIDIYDYASNEQKMFRTFHKYVYSTSSQAFTQRDGTFQSATAISSIQILINSGTFSGGTVYLYGVK